MRILVIARKGESLTGGGTYQANLLRQLGKRHEVKLYESEADLDEEWDIAHCVNLKHLPLQLAKKIRCPLTPGDRGPGVKKVQSLLQSAGFRAVTANGHYDEPTLTSVREFQKSRTGKETGIVDTLTLLQLYRSGNDRAVPSITGSGKGGGA